MSDQLPTFDHAISWDTLNATSSPAWASGPTPCGSPDGPTTGKSGPAHAPASPSARQGKRRVRAMSGTSGLSGSGLFENAAPALYSESRSPLQQSSDTLTEKLTANLKRQTDQLGSTLFRMTWKAHRTPAGRLIYRLRASARRTSDKDCTSWPTPQTHDVTTRGNTEADHHYSPHDLSNAALLAGWSTPVERDHRFANAKPYSERGGGSKGEQLNNQVVHLLSNSGVIKNISGPARLTATGEMLTGSDAQMTSGGQLRPGHSRWLMGLPPAWDVCGATAMPMAGTPAQNGNKEAGNTDSSRKTVELAGWPTPTTPSGGQKWPEGTTPTGVRPDGTKATVNLENVAKLAGPARLTASGDLLTGSSAQMESGGQLRPGHSRWLMGLPPAWDVCGATAMPSSRKSRQGS